MTCTKLAKFTVRLSLVFLLGIAHLGAFAQGNIGSDKAQLSGPRKQVAIIVFSGLAGAVLGLSTLSFYTRPQDKLQNIGVGFAVGIIAGAAYTTYNAATRPHEFYGPPNSVRLPEPELWREKDFRVTHQKSAPLSIGYQFSF